MRGRRALRAEVFAGLDDAAPEQLLPNSIRRHPRRQRVVLIHEPARQPQPIERLVFGPCVQDRRRRGVDLLASIQITAAHTQERVQDRTGDHEA